MSNDEIKELIQLVVESGIAELELERGGTVFAFAEHWSRDRSSSCRLPGASSAGNMLSKPRPPLRHLPPPPPNANEHIVKSPIVGTYYESPKPGDPPFVKVGDSVEPGQVLCIIESMKLMNEIESEIAGTIVAKLMESGRPVEYGEALFAIRPR